MFLPKGKIFFDQIDRVAQNVSESARLLEDFIAHLPASETKLKALEDKEHEGDRLTHNTLELLNKTFITPLDREDIYKLISSMDDVLDFIYGSAYRMVLYKIPGISEEFKGLARILVRATEEVCKAALRLKDLKNPQMTLAQCIEINRLENEADEAHRRAVADLFERERDPISVIKIKEILDHMETATDKCEDVANVIESIVIKNA